MRVLFLAHRLPYPPNKGDKIRSFHEIRGLAERGHEVHVVAFADCREDERMAAGLLHHAATAVTVPLDVRVAKMRALSAIVQRRPLSLAYFGQVMMRQAVSACLEHHGADVIVAYSSPMAQYVPPGRRARAVMDLVDVDSEKWSDYSKTHRRPMSWVYALEAKRLRAYELEIVRTFGATLLATEREAGLLRPDLPSESSGRLSALVNGVDTAFFHPTDVPASTETLPDAERRFFTDDWPTIVFTGAMDYHANVEAVSWFANQVWSRIRTAFPSARFLVVGSRPAPAVRALERIPGVVVTGFVQDVRPYLWCADLCVVPLMIARGVQNKLIEALACGRPVVATPEAVAALDLCPGRDVVVAQRGAEYGEAIV